MYIYIYIYIYKTKYQIINIAYKKKNVIKYEVDFTYYIYTRFPTPRALGRNTMRKNMNTLFGETLICPEFESFLSITIL